MSLEQVLKKIGRGEVAPAYYLYGGEDYLKREAAKRIVDALLPSNLRALNLEIVIGGEATGEAIVSKADTFPILAARRVILIKEADGLSSADRSTLISYLENPSPTACLVFLAEKIDQRTRFWEALQKRGLLLCFSRLAGRELRRWLEARARERGRRLQPEATELLLELVGPDLYALEGELEKVCLFLPEGETIGVESLAPLVGESRMKSIFELAEAVGRREVDVALRHLSRLLEEGEEVLKVIGMLARQLRLIRKAQDLKGSGRKAPEMAQVLGVYPGQIQSLLGQAESFPPDKLKEGLCRLLQADRDLKSGRGKPRLILDFLVMDLCR